MPRPRTLTAEQIASAALAVVDNQGLASLSMRTVANELGVATMSLYRYVADRDEVERQVVDLVLAGVDSDVPSGEPGRRIAELCRRVRQVALAHPDLVPLLLVHRHHSPATLRWGETVLEVLTEAGFAGVERVYAFRTVQAYVFGAVQAEQLGPLDGPETASMTALPLEDYPLLVATATSAAAVDGSDEEFGHGLAIVLRGLGLQL